MTMKRAIAILNGVAAATCVYMVGQQLALGNTSGVVMFAFLFAINSICFYKNFVRSF